MVSKLEATLDSKLERVALEPDAVLHPSGLECLVIGARQHGLHLTAPQLILDNLLGGDEVSSSDLIKCAAKVRNGPNCRQINANCVCTKRCPSSISSGICSRSVASASSASL